ncbi:hypothetical protein [uncultured Lactobacillus sp.]|uniref:hypothetical protein n=1 Tax=uncultured Lactobacillus sp. TaxID=153152 RepID=UPI002803C6EB|nr:hypothetical protein [uncultured Lactobacillus sp.]
MFNLNNSYSIDVKDKQLLKQFEHQLLDQNIYYPFHPIRHINCEFIHFVKGSGKDLLTDFVMHPQLRESIFNELVYISYRYLAITKYDVDDYFLRKNLVNLINLSYNSNIIDVPTFLNKIDEANKMNFN